VHLIDRGLIVIVLFTKSSMRWPDALTLSQVELRQSASLGVETLPDLVKSFW
jgi:hypothetical protein